jgi:hypothetical protein
MVPIAVKDIAEKINSTYIKSFNRDYHIQRLETIKEFCEKILNDCSVNKKK